MDRYKSLVYQWFGIAFPMVMISTLVCFRSSGDASQVKVIVLFPARIWGIFPWVRIVETVNPFSSNIAASIKKQPWRPFILVDNRQWRFRNFEIFPAGKIKPNKVIANSNHTVVLQLNIKKNTAVIPEYPDARSGMREEVKRFRKSQGLRCSGTSLVRIEIG